LFSGVKYTAHAGAQVLFEILSLMVFSPAIPKR
jgi:hypothetical protein